MLNITKDAFNRLVFTIYCVVHTFNTRGSLLIVNLYLILCMDFCTPMHINFKNFLDIISEDRIDNKKRKLHS